MKFRTNTLRDRPGASPSWLSSLKSAIFLHDFAQTLNHVDIPTAQRFRLFKVIMVFAIFVFAGTIFEVLNAGGNNATVLIVIGILFIGIFVNYFALNFHKNGPVAYAIILALSYSILHLLCYGQGGVRNSGIFFLSTLILGAFMFFGKTGGRFMSAIAIAHITYFYFLSTYTNLTDYSMIGNEAVNINLDFLLTIVVGTVLLAGQASYIETTNNAVIEDIEAKRDELRLKNEQLLDIQEDLKTKNMELKLKNKELEQFAYVASHDLQEPLRTVVSFVDLLKRQYQGDLDERADKYLGYISQASNRMETLIRDLLEFSRIGKTMHLQEVHCHDLVKEVCEDMRATIEESGAVVEMSNLPTINACRLEIKLLFQNLISNAIKFRRPGISPIISIRAAKNEQNWLFAVADNGIGIAKEHFERIFVIFQRLHTRNEYEGSGIGLSHCKKIVEFHKGRIWLESTPWHGTTFYFTIPQLTQHGKEA